MDRTLAEQEYEAFLQGVAAEPRRQHTPTPLADVVWHERMQDTRQYARDCQSRFGAFLHHIPAGNGSPYCAGLLED